MSEDRNDCANCSKLQSRVDRLEQRVDYLLNRIDEQDSAVRGAKHRVAWLEAEQRRNQDRLNEKQKEIEKRDRKIAKLEAEIKWLRKQLFGKKSEPKTPVLAPTEPSTEIVRNRGKQPGTQGYGRKIREDLPVEIVIHELPSDDACCLGCGLPFVEIDSSEPSEEIVWEHKLVRRRHLRRKYVRSCGCKQQPKIIVAPPATKLIPKGLFGTEFWINVLVEKYFLQRPLHKVCQQLKSLGLDVSQGTLTGGLKKLLPLFMPLYEQILLRSQLSNRWQMDETHWNVFVDVEEKRNHTWWMWVALTDDTCAFVLDPTRSAQVPLKYFKHNQHGILTTDRYSSYQALPEGIVHSYCWSHVRRDFINLRDGYPELAPFAQSWIELIGDAFHHNGVRLSESRSATEREEAEEHLRQTIRLMEKKLAKQVAQKSLTEPAKKVLTSLKKFWSGLIVFVDCPAIPMDNNDCERSLRSLVVGRKNYYGSGALWSGDLAVVLFTLFATLARNKVDERKWLTTYLRACAENGGKPPPDPGSYLPWNQRANEPATPAVY